MDMESVGARHDGPGQHELPRVGTQRPYRSRWVRCSEGAGVACRISRAVTGGIKGALGLAEDTSDASITCRQVGPIKLAGDLRSTRSKALVVHMWKPVGHGQRCNLMSQNDANKRAAEALNRRQRQLI